MDIPNGWMLCSPQTVGGFSAVGYYFGLKILKETGVPIGLIGNAWGGTPIEPWTNLEGLSLIPELAPQQKDFVKVMTAYEGQLTKVVEPMGRWVELARAAQLKGERVSVPPALPPHPVSTLTIWTSIYNSRVAPLVPFGIKGALWYQGEANGGEGDIYFNKMQALFSSRVCKFLTQEWAWQLTLEMLPTFIR
jgi:sialate O-acetylesterase